MIRVVIADDEREARAKLRRLLSTHEDVTVVGEAQNGRAAIAAIEEHGPELVLLDIRMPELDGFQVLRTLSGQTAAPKIVFVTAYDEYAIEAFEVRAIDYLLKPFDGGRLAAALDRVRRQLELEQRPSLSSTLGS